VSELLQALAIVIPLGLLYVAILGIMAGMFHTFAENKQNATSDDDEAAELVIEKPASTVWINSPSDVFHYVNQRIGGNPVEYLILLLVSSDRRLVVEFRCTDKQSGYVRLPKVERIIRHCVENEVNLVFLVHNHPYGTPYPSVEDVHYTARLAQKLQQAGIELSDHIVVTAAGSYSMKNNNYFSV
jgi:DNA repair protein RadC